MWPLRNYVATPDDTARTRACVAIFCVVLAVLAGVWPGQDANWDLRNYHFYNVHAWFNGRYDIDIAPAQLQSWHNPTGDIPYYAFVHAGFPSWLATALLALPAAVALYFLARLFVLLAPEQSTPVAIAALLLVGATGAAGGPVIGTTMSEWHTVALFIGALGILLKPEIKVQQDWKLFVIAGALGGTAVGLKLTASVFAVSLAILAFALPGSFRERSLRVCLLAVGGIAAATLVYLPWGWFVYQRTGNPVFPYLNNFFLSPLASPFDFADERFMKKSVAAIAKLPFRLMRESPGYVAEAGLRDWRMVLGFPALAYMSFAARSLRQTQRTRWRALFAFFAVSFVLWAFGSSIYRYVGVLELIASAAIVVTAGTIWPKYAALVVASVSALVIATTTNPQWGRVEHGRAAVVATLPVLPTNSAVVISSVVPLGYIVPNLPLTVPVFSLVNNFMGQADPQNMLYLRAKQQIAGHKGALWLLIDLSARDERNYLGIPVATKLLDAGVVADFADCKTFQTSMDATLAFCRLNRIY